MSLGPYEAIAPLGAGGTGEVYLAEDTRLQRRVAIKLADEMDVLTSRRVTDWRPATEEWLLSGSPIPYFTWSPIRR